MIKEKYLQHYYIEYIIVMGFMMQLMNYKLQMDLLLLDISYHLIMCLLKHMVNNMLLFMILLIIHFNLNKVILIDRYYLDIWLIVQNQLHMHSIQLMIQIQMVLG